MKKVLFTATVDSHILAFHLPYLKYFKENGYDVHVATNGDEEIPYCDKKHKVCFERSPFKINNLKAIQQLKKIINNEEFDIIHTHTPMGSVVTRLAAKKSRKKYHTKVIYTAHGFHFYKGSPKKFWMMFYPVEKFLAKYTDDLITVNKEDYEFAKRKFKTNVHYVPGVGIDPKKFDVKMTNKEKEDLRKSLNLKNDDFVMIYPAELNKNKNQIFLIKCMEELVKKYSNIHLLLVGKDSYNGFYQNIVKEKNLKNIHFLGFRKDIPQLLSISNISLSSSLREGLPVNIIEAMYMGLPVVANNCRGMSDLIENDKNGFLIKNSNLNKFMKSIESIYFNKIDLNKISLNNKEKSSNYLIDKVLDEYIKIYNLNKRKKIMFYTMSMEKGGAERVISNLSNFFISKYDITICTNVIGASYYPLNEGVKHIKMDSKPINNLFQKIIFKIGPIRNRQLKKVIKKEKPDIIVSFLPEPSFRILSLKKKVNIPIIISDRNDPKTEYSNFIIRYIMKKTYKKADGFVFQTPDARDYFKDIIKCDGVIIPNPINNDFLVDDICQNRRRTVVTVGRLTEQKNHKLLINAFGKFLELCPDYSLYIYGDGNLKSQLMEYILSKKLIGKVILKGIVDDIKSEIYDAGMFVMSSDYEGMPNALMEAMALGIPCISTDCSGGGAKYLIGNNENGILVPINDVEALTDAMKKVATDLKYANKIGLNANLFTKQLDSNLICQKWEEYINSHMKG